MSFSSLDCVWVFHSTYTKTYVNSHHTMIVCMFLILILYNGWNWHIHIALWMIAGLSHSLFLFIRLLHCILFESFILIFDYDCLQHSITLLSSCYYINLGLWLRLSKFTVLLWILLYCVFCKTHILFCNCLEYSHMGMWLYVRV